LKGWWRLRSPGRRSSIGAMINEFIDGVLAKMIEGWNATIGE